MEERIVTYVSGDITFIMREIWNSDGDPVQSEVVGFYYGEPNEEDTEYFKTKGVISKYGRNTDMVKPLPIDDRQERIDLMVETVNNAIQKAKADWSECRETSFPYNQEDAYFKDVRQIFEDAGYSIFVNIYARCGGTYYTIAW